MLLNMSNKKNEFRLKAMADLKNQPDNLDEKSRLIWKRLLESKVFQSMQNNGNLLIYMDFGFEVRTTRFLSEIFSLPVLIPACEDNEIVVYRLNSPDELQPGAFGILELRRELRAERRTKPAEINCVLVPGLAFDEQGNRLGRGKGFYDRFLAKLSADVLLIAPTFDCQVYSSIPHDAHDKPVDLIITESRSIVGLSAKTRSAKKR